MWNEINCCLFFYSHFIFTLVEFIYYLYRPQGFCVRYFTLLYPRFCYKKLDKEGIFSSNVHNASKECTIAQ